MSLTLDRHLDSLFHYGLNLMRENEEGIVYEWSQMKESFQKTGKRTSKTITYSINLFADLMFTYPLEKGVFLQQMKEGWTQLMGNMPVDQFILTLLESAVHHAMKELPQDNYKDYQAIQYVFNQIGETVLSEKVDTPFAYDQFLEQLVHSQQLPIEWVAVIIKEDDLYKVHKWFDKQDRKSVV